MNRSAAVRIAAVAAALLAAATGMLRAQDFLDTTLNVRVESGRSVDTEFVLPVPEK